MSNRVSPNEPQCLELKDIKGLITALEEIASSPTDERRECREDDFSVGKVPKISIENYFSRILKYCKIEMGTFITMIILLDRAAEKISLTYYNIHRLILISMISAIKFTCDHVSSLDFYAKVGGITCKEMVAIETSYLKLLDYKLFVSKEEYEKYSRFLKVSS